ncbi:MAG: histidine phosphatase family protein [Rhodococcus sp.]|uniref:SixA phosphatase family protein n=1 Tax=Rhodococcus TaxID=1827 RepID=UPI0016A8AE2C|nr:MULTISPECIES: histidine phosphatase family protein [Rhodococcus]NLV79772.1 histidine phosphatase family protein [Rhodococcus sp. (in: high G+C Gram-positive bacteria)]
MMRTLILLRHGKSAYPDDVSDHERPLSPRGRREAGLAGRWIRATLPPVDTVLCSTATRTRKTLAEATAEAPEDIPVDYRDALYGATPDELVAEIRDVGEDVRTLLVVGHEPTLSATALALATDLTGDAAQQIAEKFPTSAVAVLTVHGDWADLAPGHAELADFHIAR